MRYFVCLLLLLTACGEDEPMCNTGFIVSEESVRAAQCGQANGTLMLTASGGGGLVTYRIDDGVPQTSATFTNLRPGNYQITAQDEAGCTAGMTVNIPEADPPWTITTETISARCNQATGSIMVRVNGGTAPYRYRLDSTAFGSETTFDSLLPGEYAVSVRDANGCVAVDNARVASEVSFEEKVYNIITTNCALAGCHDSGHSADFTVRDNIFKYAESIQERTTDRSMPLGRELTDEEIAQISCWVNDGAPDN